MYVFCPLPLFDVRADWVAFTIAFILKILHSSDPASASKAALAAIKKAEPSEMTHFDPELVSPLSDILYCEADIGSTRNSLTL